MLSLAVLALGCGSRDGRTGPRQAQVPAGPKAPLGPAPIPEHVPGPGLAHARAGEFIHPADRAAYGSPILEHLAASPRSTNHAKLLRRHVHLATEHYATHIQGSRIRIFAQSDFPDARIKGVRLEGLGASSDPGLQIHLHMNSGPYVYRDGEGYVNFANHDIGGGALDGGFVQEEILMLEGTFLPWVASLRKSGRQGTAFCPEAGLRRLDEKPAVIQFRRFLEVAHPAEIYGNRLEGAHPFQEERYLRLLDRPMDIYTLAMAAKPFQGASSQYAPADLTAMTLLATRGFYELMKAQLEDGKPLVVHSGNWGTGAFGNSHRTMWAIQWAALEAAYALLAQITPGPLPAVVYHYDAYDARGLHQARVAEARLTGLFAGRTETVETFLQALWTLTQTEPGWQPFNR